VNNVKKLQAGGFRLSYNYCRICGRTPQTNLDEANYAPVRFWDPDDGFVIGTLCRWCIEASGDAQPHPDDYAHEDTNGVCDAEDTDEDATEALYGY
jgi:hypothetical protein